MQTCWPWVWTQTMQCKKAYGRQLDQKQPPVSCYVIMFSSYISKILTYLCAKCHTGRADRDRMSQRQRKELHIIQRYKEKVKSKKRGRKCRVSARLPRAERINLLLSAQVEECDLVWFAHSCVWSAHHTYGSGFERRLHLLVLQFLPVHVAKEAVLPDVSLALRTAAQPLRWMLRHQLDTRGETRHDFCTICPALCSACCPYLHSPILIVCICAEAANTHLFFPLSFHSFGIPILIIYELQSICSCFVSYNENSLSGG